MKLLILTQKVDREDDVLGFFHGWLLELAKKFDQIIVICLSEGRHDLPSNVLILSLGKETGKSRLKYLRNFYKYIWQYRNDYDAVLAHMNDIYVVLGGLLWRLWHKKIYLWRNHIKGTWLAYWAAGLSRTIFYTSPFAFVARFKNSRIMPAGVDTEMFKRDSRVVREENSFFYLGRISPVKKIEVFIRALAVLKDKNISFNAYVIGDPPARDKDYAARLKDEVATSGLSKMVSFLSGVPNYQVPEICNRYQISVNMTNSGSLDKTILEAMACENLVLVSNQSFAGKINSDFIFTEDDPAGMAAKAQILLAYNEDKIIGAGSTLRNFVIGEHALSKLIDRLAHEIID